MRGSAGHETSLVTFGRSRSFGSVSLCIILGRHGNVANLACCLMWNRNFKCRWGKGVFVYWQCCPNYLWWVQVSPIIIPKHSTLSKIIGGIVHVVTLGIPYAVGVASWLGFFNSDEIFPACNNPQGAIAWLYQSASAAWIASQRKNINCQRWSY